MAEVKRVNGRLIVDYMARDYDSLLQAMREQIPSLLPEWQQYASEADFGNVLLQLFAHMGDMLSYYQDRVANESFLTTAQTRRSVIDHLALIGYKLSTAAPAAASLTLSVPASYNDRLTIRKGNAFATKSQEGRPSVRFEYTRDADLVIDCSQLPASSGDRPLKHFPGIPVEEGRLIRDEILGISTGAPNQRFELANPGLILRSLGLASAKDIILVVAGEAWTLQESLAFSRAHQRDVLVAIDELDRATIVFGNGDYGAIPPKGSTIQVTYRVGGGRQGNVAAQAIQTIVDAPQLALAGAAIANPQPATGGADRERIEDAVRQAPAVFRSLKRAVTADDYKALALQYNGVGKVRAAAAGWNKVKLFVAPQEGGQISDILKANLLAFFEDKRPITTVIEIEDVDYVGIYITADIGVSSYYDVEEVKALARAAAGRLLAFDAVDFAQVLYLSRFYDAIDRVEGVEYLTITEFRSQRASEDHVASAARRELDSGIIRLGENEIPVAPDNQAYAGGIKVVVGGGT
jgi:hypothetical protein